MAIGKRKRDRQPRIRVTIKDLPTDAETLRVGTPRALQGRLAARTTVLTTMWSIILDATAR